MWETRMRALVGGGEKKHKEAEQENIGNVKGEGNVMGIEAKKGKSWQWPIRPVREISN